MRQEILTDTFTALRNKLHIAACRLLDDETDAEDAVQDTFCNLWNASPPDTNAEARHRLFAALKNVCLNKLRRRAVEAKYPGTTVIVNPDETPGDFDTMKEAMLSALPPQQREVLRLAAFEELEYEEIAERLNMTIDAVRMNMSRARKKLREEYKRFQS
ncbi:MAG: sigma-70 family RNA polymerase sigma factor [Muribaculaceae bacterium]|nr:sigma-70 family RNA polymerase sigma factor [Muribaculaceae bacterium]